MVILEKQLAVATIHWRYEQERFYFEMINAEGQLLHVQEEGVLLKTESLRKPGNKNVQAHTAVHEAGHAVLAALTLRIVPTVVVSKTASGDCEGFCLISFPEGPQTKETIRKDIIISLGGYAAERLIFGDENTSSGVRRDIEMATELANRAIRKYAMGTDPILISVESVNAEDHFYHQEKYTQEAMRIIKTGMQQAEEILKRNKLLLLKMSDYLTTNARMEGKMIADFVQQYSTEDWVLLEGFIKKDEYFHFYEDVQRQIQALEKGGVHHYKPEPVTV
jgi:cell division protease FtsH